MKRRDKNKFLKQNSIEQIQDMAIVQLTDEIIKLRRFFFALIKAHDTTITPQIFDEYCEKAIKADAKIDDEIRMKALKQCDDYINYIRMSKKIKTIRKEWE